MSKQQIRSVKFRPDSLVKIQQMNDIIDEYLAQDLRLTARQLFYQLVSRDMIPNTPKSYKATTALLTDARYSGLTDWDAIEDRGREPSMPSEWRDLASLAESALRAYRLPRWKGQNTYAELWVEKQALAGVLEPLAFDHHVTLMVNKGYSSASAMKESADRIARKCDGSDTTCEPIIFYLGDHDPSGEDMVRDIRDRLTEFGVENLEVRKIALTMAQVKQYRPPPNPAKVTDPRAAAYIEKFGDSSWEVDALPPEVLSRLIRTAFAGVIDDEQMDAVKEREETDKKLLRAAVKDLGGAA